jgi:hypothetical protein
MAKSEASSITTLTTSEMATIMGVVMERERKSTPVIL